MNSCEVVAGEFSEMGVKIVTPEVNGDGSQYRSYRSW